jgi:CBS domain containing-hemolysin-like protein
VSPEVAIPLSLLLLALNAFFVGAEFALISVRRAAIEPLAAEGKRSARITLQALEHVSVMMAAAQLGITVCSLGLGLLAKPAIDALVAPAFAAVGLSEGLADAASFAVALTIVSYLHVVVGEMIPKNLALALPERSALVLGPLLAVVVRLLGPVVTGLNRLANAILRAVGVEPKDEVTSAFTRDEVAALVGESRREGLLDPGEERLVVGALSLEERPVSMVLLPVADLVTVPADITPAQLEEVAARAGFSRYPVTREDRIVGYLHVKDVLEFEERHRTRPIAEGWIRQLPTVTATDPLRRVLRAMQRSGAHLALVRGAEDARVLGVVALEDVVEELVGEVRDEVGGLVRS